MATAHSQYELDIRLRDIEPPIWRTLEVAGDTTLEDLHYAIQIAMGWTNSHLHMFVIGQLTYGMTEVDEADDLLDERAYALQDLAKQGAEFLYVYDFGDDWAHEVTVKRVQAAAKPVRPRCLAGARACPPEDCGGLPGYERLVAALADPKHPDHAELRAWAPKGFDPERFVVPAKDLTRAIEELRRFADDGDGDNSSAELLNSLPRPLVEAALAMAPMQRASLIALLAGSLGNQLMSAINVIGRARRAPPPAKPRKHGNGGSRRSR